MMTSRDIAINDDVEENKSEQYLNDAKEVTSE